MSSLAEQARYAFEVEPSTRPYRLRLARYVALAEAIVAHVTQHHRKTASPSILVDVGAGRGRTLRYLESHLPEGSVRFIAVEHNPRHLQALYGKENWKCLLADLDEGLPFETASADIVVCEQVLEHIARPHFALGELARILKRGGCLIVGVPTFPPGLAKLRELVAPLRDSLQGKRGPHIQTFTSRSFRQAVEMTGSFQIECLRGFPDLLRVGFLEEYEWWWRWNRLWGRKVSCVVYRDTDCRKP